jgi:hypothetical protein
VNRGWVPRGWRDKNINDDQNVDEASELQEAVKKTDEKSSWWKFWSKESKSSADVIYIPCFWYHIRSIYYQNLECEFSNSLLLCLLGRITMHPVCIIIRMLVTLC